MYTVDTIMSTFTQTIYEHTNILYHISNTQTIKAFLGGAGEVRHSLGGFMLLLRDQSGDMGASNQAHEMTGLFLLNQCRGLSPLSY